MLLFIVTGILDVLQSRQKKRECWGQLGSVKGWSIAVRKCISVVDMTN